MSDSSCVHNWEKLYRDWMRCAACGEFMQEAAPAATPDPMASAQGHQVYGNPGPKHPLDEETRAWAQPWRKG